MSDENILDYKSLKDLVYDYLRKNMEDGVFKPGDLIDEKNLSNKLKISRTPVREALILLQAEGFVTILPRRRMFVNELKLQDIEDIYQLLGALEGAAAAGAVEKMTDEDLKKLEDMTMKMRRALEEGDFETYGNYNWEIHDLFLKINGNRILRRIVTLHKKRIYSFPHILKKKEILQREIPQWDAQTMEYHEKMVELCKKKDKDGLRELIRDYHWSFEKRRPILLAYYQSDKA
jgi:DNA-binding GntR family transcriptional regulator